MKPGFGVLDVSGVYPLSATLDHLGVLAPDVSSARSVLEVLVPGMSWTAPRPRRIGIDRAAIESADPVVAQRVESAIARLEDVELRDVKMPDSELVFAASTAIMFSEAAALHGPTLRRRAADYGQDVRDRLVLGAAITAAGYLTALSLRDRIRREVVALLSQVDAVLGPTVGLVAPTRDEARNPSLAGRLVQNTRLANVAGLPAVSIPLPGDGLPVGLQLIALGNGTVLSAADYVEACLAKPLLVGSV